MTNLQTPHARRRLFRLLAALPLAGLVSRDAVAAPSGDPLARNAEAIRRHHGVLNTGDIDAAVQFYAEDTLNHGHPVGRAGLRLVLADIFTTFPDWRMAIDELAAVDDRVIARITVTGTHRGVGRMPINGGLLIGVPPTGRSFSVQHIHWFVMREGLIAAHWAERNDISMMQQLGLLPATPKYG